MAKHFTFPAPRVLTKIVKEAILFTVIDLGQLSRAEHLELDRAVAAGVLVKGRGGPYVALKTVWASPQYDFAAERKAEIALMGYLEKVTRRAA